MKNIRFLSLAVVVGLFVTSCVTESQKNDVKETVDNVNIEVIEKEEINVEVKNQPNKKGKKAKKENPKEQAPTIVEEPKVEEAPKEIGASPDAVYFLDDSETESTPKYPEGEKALKKAIKNKLRKAKKGEKAKFRASIVIKSDGSVERVQFTECGYNDEYKAEIVDALKSLPAFEPGMKDGKAVDSWYYLNYKR